MSTGLALSLIKARDAEQNKVMQDAFDNFVNQVESRISHVFQFINKMVEAK
jgi:hypothetical protein